MKIFYFLGLLLLISCAENNTGDNIVNVDYKNLHDIKLSDYIDTLKTVKLETGNEVLIGGFILKIRIFDSKIFLIEMTTRSLFVFNENGNFLYKINKVGQGPGEYLSLFDFEISDKGLFLCTGNSILHYSFDGTYIKTIPFDFVATAMILDGQNIVLYSEPDQKNQISVFDMQGNLIKQFFPAGIEVKANYASTNMLIGYNSDKYFSPRHGNDFYKWNGINDWDKFISISFGDKTMKQSASQIDNIYEPDFEFIVRKYAFIVNKTFMFSYFINGFGLAYCFHNTETKTTETGKIINDLIPGYERFYPTFQTDNRLIEIVDASYIVNECKELCNFDISLKTLKEDDNPVLFIYECK